MIAGLTAASSKEKGPKVGMAVQDLSNPTWAGYCQAIKKEVDSKGGSLNFVACESNVNKQITQIENFVSSGVNVLIVHPADPAGVEDALKQAREKGVKVLAWDDNLENSDIAWLIDNHKLGYLIGEHAAKWINEKLGGKAKVAILITRNCRSCLHGVMVLRRPLPSWRQTQKSSQKQAPSILRKALARWKRFSRPT